MTEIYINPKSLLTFPEVIQILKMSRTSITKMIKDGIFPPAILKPTSKSQSIRNMRKYWIYQDIMKFIDEMKLGDLSRYESKHKAVMNKNRTYKI